ncbi:hypothetical protein [Desulfosporosinus youngiae]|uniref:Uncharacterized protein n=1 Tax=Desulfosporosinus youngiae DSM 17734 TaxID=768710 RepID=H5XUS0_9FIRM|nr:hypothetical protein [Desulfosporosinus youngiae]EHQ89227.1 hypothetical protein DesyoDRAFT_2140 [Desulfosporosinus youngiae DSM 17734]
MIGSLTSNTYAAMMSDHQETRDICLVPYHVTFASLNKVKFYRDFNMEVNSEFISYLEREAQSTISKLKNTSLFRNGVIENVTSDINVSERIIYFDVILASKVTHTSFIELLGYLNNCLQNKR